MKKILLLALLSALTAVAMGQAAGPAGAPPQSSAPQKKGAKLNRAEIAKLNEEILAKLDLTDDQKTKIKVHKDELAAKLKELRKGAKGGDKEAMKEKVKALHKEDQAFMKQTLTKEQMRELMKMRREKMKELAAKKTATP